MTEKRPEDPPRSNRGKPPVLRGTRPSDILERLDRDDSIELWPRTLAAIQENAWLLDPEELYVRTAAHVALRAPSWDGHDPPFEDWLRARLEEAARELIAQDLEDDRQGILPQPPLDHRFAIVAALGVEPSSTLHAVVRFHELPRSARRVFQLRAVEGRSAAEVAAIEGSTEDEVEHSLAQALFALLGPDDLRGEFGDRTGLPGGGTR